MQGFEGLKRGLKWDQKCSVVKELRSIIGKEFREMCVRGCACVRACVLSDSQISEVV